MEEIQILTPTVSMAGWRNGGSQIWTTSPTPSVGDVYYTKAASSSPMVVTGKITAVSTDWIKIEGSNIQYTRYADYDDDAEIEYEIKGNNIVSGYYYNNQFYSDAAHTSALVPESGKLYIDLTDGNNATYIYNSGEYQPTSNDIKDKVTELEGSAVKTVEQTLTLEKQAIVRNNIGASPVVSISQNTQTGDNIADVTIGGVTTNIKSGLNAVNVNSFIKRALIEYNYVVESTNWTLVTSSSYDVGWSAINVDSGNVVIKNVTPYRVTFYSSNVINSTNKLTSYPASQIPASKTLPIPAGAKYMLVNYRHADANDYSVMVIEQDGAGATHKDVMNDISPIYPLIRTCGSALSASSKGVFIDYNHIPSYNAGSVYYVESDDFDTAWISIKNGCSSIVVEGAIITRIIEYSSVEKVETSTFIGSSNSPSYTPHANGKLITITLRKSDNPSGYGNLVVRQTTANDTTLLNVTNAVTENIYVNAVKFGVQEGGFWYNGSWNANENWRVDLYSINGQKFVYSGFRQANSGVNFIAYLDETYNLIYTEGEGGTISESKTAYRETTTIPDNAVYIGLQIKTPFEETFKMEEITSTEYIQSRDLRNRLNNMDNKLMKVVITNNVPYVRTELDSERDIIIKMQLVQNNLTFYNSYLGSKSLSDGDIMTHPMQVSFADATGAIENSKFGYIMGQHGYCCIKIVPNGGSWNLDQSDLNSKWHDQNNYTYSLAKITSSYAILTPICYTDGVEPGYEYRDWTNYNLPYPTILHHDSGATHTSDINVTGSRYDLVMAQRAAMKFVCDGNVVSDDGIYYCDDFSVLEETIGYHPAFVTSWFPTPTYDKELIRFISSYQFKGASVCRNLVVNFVYPFMLNQFFFCIPQLQMTGESGGVGYNIIPKASLTEHNGTPVNEPFQLTSTIAIRRKADEIDDVNKMPERLIGLWKDKNNRWSYGGAGGYSLIDGMTIDSVRNQNLPINDQCCGLYFGDSYHNKWYPRYLVSGNVYEDKVTNGMMQLSCFYSWFSCTENDGQVFWYKTGNTYLVYAHAQSADSKAILNLPSYMNGLKVTQTIEKTDGATLLTDVVTDNKLYVEYSGTNNYIVLKLQ